jgi:hypothetical protein
MTIRATDDGTIVLDGTCPADDAETLARLLLLDPSSIVDWRGCDHVHTAVVQILLAVRPPLRGPPRTLFLSNWVAGLIAEAKV